MAFYAMVLDPRPPFKPMQTKILNRLKEIASNLPEDIREVIKNLKDWEIKCSHITVYYGNLKDMSIAMIDFIRNTKFKMIFEITDIGMREGVLAVRVEPILRKGEDFVTSSKFPHITIAVKDAAPVLANSITEWTDVRQYFDHARHGGFYISGRLERIH